VKTRGPKVCDTQWNAIMAAIDRAGVFDMLNGIPNFTDQNNCPAFTIGA
jgi:hypothetical protein